MQTTSKMSGEIVQHLFTNIDKPARSKWDSRQANTHVDHLLLKLVDEMHSIWNASPFLDWAQEVVKEASDEHANYNTAELDKSRPVKKGAATRRRLSNSGGKKTTQWTGSSQHARDGYKLRRKGNRRAADSRGADWRGGGRHGGV